MKASYRPSRFLLKNESPGNPGTIICSLGSPLLFHGISMGAFSALALFAAFRHSIPLLILCLTFLILALVSRLWSRLSLQGLSCRITLDRTRAFPDEAVEISFELINEKWLPLPLSLIHI